MAAGRMASRDGARAGTPENRLYDRPPSRLSQPEHRRGRLEKLPKRSPLSHVLPHGASEEPRGSALAARLAPASEIPCRTQGPHQGRPDRAALQWQAMGEPGAATEAIQQLPREADGEGLGRAGAD